MDMQACSQGICSPSCEHSRHTPDNALDPGWFPDSQHLGLLDSVHQAMEGHQHAMVGLRSGDLAKATVGCQSQESPLFTGDGSTVTQVPLVTHDDDGSSLGARVIFH